MDDDMIAPEQALSRLDRPLVQWGLKWNPHQVVAVGGALVVGAAWTLGWVLWGVATNMFMTLEGLRVMLPWLAAPWVLLLMGGWYGKRLLRDGVEPVARQRWARRYRLLRVPIRVDTRLFAVPWLRVRQGVVRSTVSAPRRRQKGRR